MLIAKNPCTEETIKEHPPLNGQQMAERIEACHAAFPAWRDLSFDQRGDYMRAVAAQLREHKSQLADVMAMEMGKPVKEGGPEVEKAATCFEFYADKAEGYLAREELPSDASLSYVCYQPLGTLIGILPWNAPMWLAARYLAPSLMAGNTCTLKHDPNVPGSADLLTQVFEKAGLPEAVMVNLPLETPMVEEAIRHPKISAVSFTGSANAGAKVAAIAASDIKPAVLELGGSDPIIVAADADLDTAADVITLSRIINAGQSCIAAKRILVESSVYDSFVDKLKQRLEKLKLGDPLKDDTDIGPIARADLRDNLHRQVQATVQAGARCLLGGELPEGKGYFYPVTLLADITADQCAWREETFGPVMCCSSFDTLEQAVAMANDTEYGLGAGIWMADQNKAQELAAQIESGQVAINGIVKTDPRLPSGGIKRSGYGRELGPHGIREFVNAKQVWVK